MKCSICDRKTDRLFMDGTSICADCAKDKGYDVCTETGTYINFLCSHVCGDCEYKESNC